MMNLLAQYSREVGCSDFTLGSLIDSHRRLREMLSTASKEKMSAYSEAVSRGQEHGNKLVTDGLYIEVEKLRNMTVKELVDWIGDNT